MNQYATFYTFDLNNRHEFYFGSKENVEKVFYKHALLMKQRKTWGGCMYIQETLEKHLKEVNEEKSRCWIDEDKHPNYYINVDTLEEEMILQ